ncbi:MAG: HXXEE domain-containing protein [Spirochaetes bacterium]|nr:HXXEE domain-containing protein [Spirochaetota bacterium]
MKDFNLRLFYIVPVIFTAHNLEEALGMAEWSRRFPGPFNPPVTETQFHIAVSLVTLFGIAAVIASRLFRGGRYFVFAMTALNSVLLINAFFPHILATVINGSPAPGVFTAVLLYLPVCTYLLMRTFRERLISRKEYAAALVAGPVIGLAVTAATLMIGMRF